jgi:hypothetical protein
VRGLADNKFMKNGLGVWDPVGGAVALQEHFAKVAKEMRGLTLQRGISILHRE